MLRYLICALLFAPFGALAENCGDRLAFALASVMMVEGDRDPNDPLARLDRDILDWLIAQTKDFTSGQTENLLWTLENPDYKAKVQPSPGFGDPNKAEILGAVAFEEEGLLLRLGIFEITNELARAVMVHELKHLIRMTVAGDRQESALRGIELISRPLGFYREEIHAYRESYRYYRRNYSEADFARLTQSTEEWEELKSVLLAHGLIEFIDNHMMVHLNLVSTRREARLIRDFFAFSAKAHLLANVRDALSMSEPEWVKSRIGPPYRAYQAAIQPRRPSRWKKLLRSMRIFN